MKAVAWLAGVVDTQGSFGYQEHNGTIVPSFLLALNDNELRRVVSQILFEQRIEHAQYNRTLVVVGAHACEKLCQVLRSELKLKARKLHTLSMLCAAVLTVQKQDVIWESTDGLKRHQPILERHNANFR